tara:strand:+ start:1319 stop:1786 length:468 start_codon:yes stop_codon:yes gene_type:complete
MNNFDLRKYLAEGELLKEMDVNSYLKDFKGKQGLYIITPKDKKVLKDICDKLGYTYTSDIAYIGKAELKKSTDLKKRARQEMGYSNFEGATFVKKMGIYLDYDIKDKKNPILKTNTREFIHNNFNIKCIPLEDNIQQTETQYIQKYKPCLNNKKK